MRNLFVCHSQSHLILSAGLSAGRFSGDENHLVLFRDFNLKNELEKKLQTVFTSCIFLSGTFPASENMTWRGRIRWYREDNSVLKKAITVPFDRVFAVCDWTFPVQYCLKRCYELNRKTDFIWLEDGILPYFANTDVVSGLDGNRITLALRKLVFKYLLRIGRIYDRDFMEMGGLSLFRKAAVSYPDAVREPYCSMRQLIAVSADEFMRGISSLYEMDASLSIQNGSVLLVMDKLDSYYNPTLVSDAVSDIIASAKELGQTVYCKFHPREDSDWPVFDSCDKLDKNVGAESLFLSLAKQKDSITIIGAKSAGLVSAKKMGYKVDSIFNLTGEDNPNLKSFFSKIGINLLG